MCDISTSTLIHNNNKSLIIKPNQPECCFMVKDKDEAKTSVMQLCCWLAASYMKTEEIKAVETTTLWMIHR